MPAAPTFMVRCRSAGRLRGFLRHRILLRRWRPRDLPQTPTRADTQAALAQLAGADLGRRVDAAAAQADQQAKRIGGCARDAYIVLYGCAGGAVLLAACGVAAADHVILIDLLLLAELLTLLLLFLTFRGAHRMQWHGRWLGLRHHAEFLRALPLLAALDPAAEPARQAARRRAPDNRRGAHPAPHLSALGGRHENDERAQADEDCRGVLRDSLEAELRQRRQAAPQAYVARSLVYASLLARQQLRYHCLHSQQEQAIVHRVHRLSLLAFGLTIVAVLTHFWWHAPVLTIICTGVPAFAASLHGFLAQEESERLAASYRLMAHRLHDWLETGLGDDAPPQSQQDHLAQLVRLLMADVQDWRQLFDDKTMYHLG